MEDIKKSKLSIIAFVIIALWILAFILSTLIPVLSSQSYFGKGNVALIKINGVIMAESSNSLIGSSTSSSSDIVELIESANSNPNINAILFEINSPGGSAVASLEINNAIRKVNKTTIAYIREVGASGGYWVASSTEYIMANPLSITGSIGVISSYLEFSGLMEKYGVNYQRLVAGEYKDVGTPFRSLSKEEEKLLLEKLDLIHEFFISSVAENRNMDKMEVEKLATGMFYLGTEALELGLIDETGDIEDAENYIKTKLGIEEIHLVEYRKERTFFDKFAGVLNQNFFFLGKGLSSIDSQNSLIRT